jgi:hypothetical protein
MYVPCYRLSPSAEKSMLELSPTKTIVYKDLFQYTISNIASGSSFSNLVSSGVPDIQNIIVIPVYNTINCGTQNTAVNLIEFQSPFDSCPNTTAPLCALTNFQIMIGGVNAFQQNEIYDYQNFEDELSQYGLNGNLTDVLTSGLINEQDFSNCYRYYVCSNSARKLSSEKNIPKSIQVLGTNSSNFSINLYVFVEYTKEITIDLRTGERLA